MKKIILFCALLFSTQAHSFMMLQLNLQQLTDLSEKIFVGQCVSIHPQTDANGRHILEVTYQVSEMLKGSPETQVTFYQMSPDYAQEALERRGVRYSSLDIPLPSYEVGRKI
ncbi:MAG: hypothetical protein IPJ69_11975 [Deltaproteobacteria bacterium]|nr:MAG: hypothetical protein IPJ69_11975 [Deltaproteobacteria bacterium]